MSLHSVFVIGVDGKPLTPTTPSRARKLMKAGVAKPTWSKFDVFGIQMIGETRKETPLTSMGVDNGTKFEGYSVVVGTENQINIKLDLPDKKSIVRKMEERRRLRRARRQRSRRSHSRRFDNRNNEGFIAPSQMVIIQSRLKVMRELFHIYPIATVGLEDVRFNHARYHWGANFSTVEIGKNTIRKYIADFGAKLYEFRGFDTEELRNKYGYKKKTRTKSANKFTAHCSDSLAMACEVGPGESIPVGLFIVMDDTYRPVRRRLHDSRPAKGGIRESYARGTIAGIRKGLMIKASNGKIGQLCGIDRGRYRYYDMRGKRLDTKKLLWVSNNFNTRKVDCLIFPIPGGRKDETFKMAY